MRHDTILTLHLHAPLFYRGQAPKVSGFFDPVNPDSRIEPSADTSTEERVIVFPENACIILTEDGPRIKTPFGTADFAGFQDIKISGFEPSDQNRFIIEKGNYLFYQIEVSDSKGLEEALEFFAREAWWGQDECSGSFIIRFVEEDGHTAMQIIRAIK